MSLKKNIVANYFGQFYLSIVGILVLPFYIKYLGAEAYGIIGFYAMLMSWFNILDLGLSPTIGRESARFKAKTLSASDYSSLTNALYKIFLLIAVLAGGSLFILSSFYSTSWLKSDTLANEQIIFSMQMVSITIALRWMCNLPRGIVNGAEQQVWLSLFSILIATLRFIGVIAFMAFYGYQIEVFFIYQVMVAFAEFLGLYLKSKSIVPKQSLKEVLFSSIKPIAPLLKFSLAIGFTSSVWIIITQTDKLILSKILSLKEYGHFTFAVLVASIIIHMKGPISSAIMPRLTALYSQEKIDEALSIYSKATQVLCLLMGVVSSVAIFFTELFLEVWTNDPNLAEQVYLVLRLYIIGNVFLMLSLFPFYIQYARGQLFFHLTGCIMLTLTLIPSTIIAARLYGAVGAGYAWVAIHSLFLLFWVPFVHFKLVPNLHLKWFFNDCLKIFIPLLLASAALRFIFDLDELSRIQGFFHLSFITITLLALGILFCDLTRNKLFSYLKSSYLT